MTTPSWFYTGLFVGFAVEAWLSHFFVSGWISLVYWSIAAALYVLRAFFATYSVRRRDDAK